MTDNPQERAANRGIGGHQSARMRTDVWLTPPWLLEKIGPFDLDPCAAIDMPWRTARRMLTIVDDGLSQDWSGRVFCNPPYGREAAKWLARMAQHANGIALVFARTETAMWRDYVWPCATAINFIHGRIHFHFPDGRRAPANSGGPSALIAYSEADAAALSNVSGAIVLLGGRADDR